jgi:hypothetical protein
VVPQICCSPPLIVPVNVIMTRSEANEERDKEERGGEREDKERR